MKNTLRTGFLIASHIIVVELQFMNVTMWTGS